MYHISFLISSDPGLSSCVEWREYLQNRGEVAFDGYYHTTIDGTAHIVYCDMETDGGGWMLTFTSVSK